MRILSIYPNADGNGRIPTGLAIIMTVLKNAGYEIELFDTTFFHGTSRDNDKREEAKLVKKVESFYGPDIDTAYGLEIIDGKPSIVYDSFSTEKINALLLEKLKKLNPSVVIISLIEDNYKWADSLLGIVKDYNSSIKVIVGGPTPSAAPEIIIENPQIDFLIQGEGEEAIVDLCDSLKNGDDNFPSIQNLWYKVNGQVRSNPLRPFINMDTVPIQDMEMWDRRHFYKPYDGGMYMTGHFEMSRGCPNQCTYCVNHTIRRRLKTAGKYFRRKSPRVAIEEIKYHKEKYDLRRIVFCDDNFLLMPKSQFGEWAEEFKSLWLSEINLPYWIATTVDSINRDTLQLLKDTGCGGVGLGIEAGGEWFRKNILKRYYTNEFIKNAFDLLHEYDIRTTGNVMIGFPGETEEDIFETIKVMRIIKPRSFSLALVTPYVGTDLHRVVVELGLIDVSDKPGFRGMSTDVSFRQHSTIGNTNISPERFRELYDGFIDYVSGKLQIPDKYNSDVLKGDETFKTRSKESLVVADVIKKVSEEN